MPSEKNSFSMSVGAEKGLETRFPTKDWGAGLGVGGRKGCEYRKGKRTSPAELQP